MTHGAANRGLTDDGDRRGRDRSALRQLAPRLGWSATPELLVPGAGPPVVVRRERRGRRRTSGSSSSATPSSGWSSPTTCSGPTPTCPRGSWPRCGRRWSTRRPWPRWPPTWTSATPCCSARARTSSGGREKPSILADAMEALIGARLPRPRAGGGRADLIMRLLGDRIEEAAAGPGGQDYKTRLQELCARRFDQLPVYSRERRGTRPRQALRRGGSRRRVGHGAAARVAPRSRPSRPRPGWPGRSCAPSRPCPTLRTQVPVSRSPDGGRRRARSRRLRRTMPELPEVETIRRDLDKEFVGKRIKKVEVTGSRSRPPPPGPGGLHRPGRGPQAGRHRPAGQVPAAEARQRRRPRRPPGHERSAAAGRPEGAAGQAHPRGASASPAPPSCASSIPGPSASCSSPPPTRSRKRFPSWPIWASTRSRSRWPGPASANCWPPARPS